jgi:sigma-B regulation protein RsbU (phosphoserine phosphatase)
MANVAAMGIERERLAAVEEAERRHAQELAQAAEIQRRHLPARPPDWEGLEIAGDQIPSRTVGGDYYDYLQMADGRRMIIVADVAGKGMPASLLMMTVQARSQALCETCATVQEFAERLNRSLLASCPPNRFVTAIVCAVDPRSGALSYTNAGHNAGLLIRANGEVETLDSSGPFLGLLSGPSFPESSMHMGVGDLLVLYSDGITESESKEHEEYGTERLIEWIRQRSTEPLPVLLQALYRELAIWRGGGLAADDQTVVLARRV